MHVIRCIDEVAWLTSLPQGVRLSYLRYLLPCQAFCMHMCGLMLGGSMFTECFDHYSSHGAMIYFALQCATPRLKRSSLDTVL